MSCLKSLDSRGPLILVNVNGMLGTSAKIGRRQMQQHFNIDDKINNILISSIPTAIHQCVKQSYNMYVYTRIARFW